MPGKCEICGKEVATGHRVSHSNIRTKRTWSPNVQRVRIVVGKTPRRVMVCTRCLRSGRVQRAI